MDSPSNGPNMDLRTRILIAAREQAVISVRILNAMISNGNRNRYNHDALRRMPYRYEKLLKREMAKVDR